MAIPGDTIVCDKEWEKIKKYSWSKDEIATLWQRKKVGILIALGVTTKTFEKHIESLGTEIRIEHV